MSRRLLTVLGFALIVTTATACNGTSAAAPYDDATIVLAIGDSIMVTATDRLEEVLDGIIIDAEVGRPFRDGVPALERQLAGGVDPDVLVVALGTNAGTSADRIDELMVAATGIDRVIFVNVRAPRDWETSTNRAIAGAADRYDNVTVVDWYTASNDNDSLFRNDGYHPSTTGSELWANMIAIEVKR